MSETHSRPTAYVRDTMLPAQPPPARASGAVLWLRENLFSGPLNIALTLLGLGILWLLVSTFWPWLSHSVWNAGSMAECRKIIADALVGGVLAPTPGRVLVDAAALA